MINTTENEHIVTRQELIQQISKQLVQTHFAEIKLFLENHRTSKYIDVSVANNQLHFGKYGKNKIAYCHVHNPKVKLVDNKIALEFISHYLTIIPFYSLMKLIINVTELTSNEHLMMIAMNYYLFTYLSDGSDDETRNNVEYSREFVIKFRKLQVKTIVANLDLICDLLTKHPDKLDSLLEFLADEDEDYTDSIATQHDMIPEIQLIVWRLTELITTTKSFTPKVSVRNLFALLRNCDFISDNVSMSKLRLPIHYLSDFINYIYLPETLWMEKNSYSDLAPHIHFVINSKCDVLWLLSTLEAPITNITDIKSILKSGVTIDGCSKFTDYIQTWLKLIKPANDDKDVQSVVDIVMSIFYPF